MGIKKDFTVANDYQRITLYLLPEEVKAFKKKAIDLNTSMSQYMRKLVRIAINLDTPLPPEIIEDDLPQEGTVINEDSQTSDEGE